MNTAWRILVRRDGNRYRAQVLGDPQGGIYQTELHPLGIFEKTPQRAVRKAIDALPPGWTKLEVELLSGEDAGPKCNESEECEAEWHYWRCPMHKDNVLGGVS